MWRGPTAKAAAAASTVRRWTGSFERARELGVEHAPPEPLVKGRHLIALGVAPGPALGEVLRQVYERQLDGTVADFDAALALAREIAGERRLY